MNKDSATKQWHTEIVAQGDALEPALTALKKAAPIAVPTETVYGLAANAEDEKAVAAIYAAKGRPSSNPLIIHVSDYQMAAFYGSFSHKAQQLAKAFWPGALTMVVPKQPHSGLAPAVFAGHDTIAIRQPKGFMASLITAFGRPLAAPSANRSGQLTGTDAQAVFEQLNGRIPLIIDGGRTPIGLESTIIRVIDADVTLLREGGIAREVLEIFLGHEIAGLGQTKTLLAPGMMQSHYAPCAEVTLNADSLPPKAALLNFGAQSIAGITDETPIYELSASGNLDEAAYNLFSGLRALDQISGHICVVPIPQKGLGAAINDRLNRAAAERPANAG